MKSKNIFHFLIALALSACGPATLSTPSPTAVISLPDLTITSAYVSMVDNNGNCLGYYGLYVTVMNQGDAPARDVYLFETSSGQQVGIGTLDPFQSISLPFVANAESGEYTVVVDPQNTIHESNEENNTASSMNPTATPPASCPTPVQSDMSSPTLPALGLGDGSVGTPIPSYPPVIFTYFPQQYPIPVFTPPSDWSTYISSIPAYEIHYPPGGTLNVQELDVQTQSRLLTITLPIQSGTQMLEKFISVRTRLAPADGCYGDGNGITQIGGLDFLYREGIFWYPVAEKGGQRRDVFQSEYSSLPHNGFCFYILLVIEKQGNSGPPDGTTLPTPSSADLDLNILLNILSTLSLN